MYYSMFLFLNMGTPEIMIIMFAALLLFGGKKLPELARGLGKGIREFKDASEGVKREIHNSINSVTDKKDAEEFNYSGTVTSTTDHYKADDLQPQDNHTIINKADDVSAVESSKKEI